MSATLTPAQKELASAMSTELSPAIIQELREIFGKPAADAPAEKLDLAAALKGLKPGTQVDWNGLKFTQPEDKGKSGKAGAKVVVDHEAEDEADDPAVGTAGAKLLNTLEKPLNGIEFGGFKGGEIALGGILGFGASEIVNGLVSPIKLDEAGNPVLDSAGAQQVNFTNTMWKGVTAAAFAMFGQKVMSKNATMVAVAIPTVQVLADVLPLDRGINWLVKKLSRQDSAGSAQARQVRQSNNNSSVNAAIKMLNAGRATTSMGATGVYREIQGVYD